MVVYLERLTLPSWKGRPFAMPYQKNTLDERVLVWTKQPGRATSDKAIISAHGESAIINGSFPQGQYTLLYYAPHGYKLRDPGLRSVLDSIAWPMQRISADDLPKSALERIKSTKPAQDYNLTKYQGKGSANAETYQQIRDLPDTCPMDIITVRGEKHAPWWFKALDCEIKLTDLLDLVLSSGYMYTEFHCSFCRGGVVSDSGPSFTAFENRALPDDI